MTLEQLRSLLKSKSGELDTIITKAEEGDGRLLTKDEAEQVETLQAEVEDLQTQIDIAVRQKAIRAANAAPSDPDPENPGERRTAAQPEVKLTNIQKMGLTAMAVTAAEFEKREHNYTSPLKILEENGYGAFAKDVEKLRERRKEFVKTLNASTNVSGGFLTPDNQAADIIELLYPETTFLQGGPRRVNMPNGVYRQPAGATGSSASYRQEGGEIQTTEPTFKEVAMSTKFLGAIVPMTQEMIDFSLSGVQAFVEQDLREAMGQEMDAKAYYGDGDQGVPLGLFNQKDIQSVMSAEAADPTLANIDTDFSNMLLKFFNKNIRSGRWAWVMSPRTLEFLRRLRTGDAGDGQFAFPSLQGESPTFKGYPVLHSTQIPINLGGGADETEIALVNFSDVLLGMQGEIAMATSNEATVKINGQWVSAFQNNLVFLRAMSGHDIGLRRAESIVRMQSLTWGA